MPILNCPLPIPHTLHLTGRAFYFLTLTPAEKLQLPCSAETRAAKLPEPGAQARPGRQPLTQHCGLHPVQKHMRRHWWKPFAGSHCWPNPYSWQGLVQLPSEPHLWRQFSQLHLAGLQRAAKTIWGRVKGKKKMILEVRGKLLISKRHFM